MSQVEARNRSASSAFRPAITSALLVGMTGWVGASTPTGEDNKDVHAQDSEIPVLHFSQSSARPVRETLATFPHELDLSDVRTDQELRARNELLTPVRLKPTVLMAVVKQKMDELIGLQNGWYGDTSLAAAGETVADAFSLLEKLDRQMFDCPIPMIGLDSDGYVVLTWDTGNLIGSLSIFGDGTYAYYLETIDAHEKEGEALISMPISSKLINLLNA
jgi:hypothetical protein